jgi:hypothetical protein
MAESDYRPLISAIVLGMMCVVVVGVAAHFVIRNAIRDLVERTAAKQLLKDAEALRQGKPLQQINSTRAATSKVLLQAMCAKV